MNENSTLTPHPRAARKAGGMVATERQTPIGGYAIAPLYRDTQGN